MPDGHPPLQSLGRGKTAEKKQEVVGNEEMKEGIMLQMMNYLQTMD